MRIIIVGCGRLGSGLARLLSLQGHAVTVVDSDPLAFERLGPAFKGKTVVGIGFDREVLILAAVTASDDANVVAARLATQVFHVPRVVARLYDPRKAEIYQRLGLQTISPVTWGISRIADLLCRSPLETVFSLGSDVDIVEAEVPALLVGRTVKEMTILGEVHVVAITRSGKTFLPTQGTILQAGDLVHLAALTTSTERVKAILGLE